MSGQSPESGCGCGCGGQAGGNAPAEGGVVEAGTAGSGAGGQPEKGRRGDILTPSTEETRELEKFIDAGHRSSSTITLLSIAGVLLVLVGLLYWDKLDIYPYQDVSGRQWQSFGGKVLPTLLRNQHVKEVNSYRLQPNVVTPPEEPFWPRTVYFKLRTDIFLVAGLLLILCWVMLRIERAKGRRNDLLAFRALAREIEKLRLRIRELEGKGKKEGGKETVREPGKESEGGAGGNS